jgi:hypothetical protein
MQCSYDFITTSRKERTRQAVRGPILWIFQKELLDGEVQAAVFCFGGGVGKQM